ncbi:hypothetical protein [Legionella fallonii]|uniref:Uncharacterized protein n=1 Tax=Legionella fallonii LLAP-10 TaxID=1212491 RepID=A0A098G8A2_9GAMM|nr:hypothetical protein [Legionella fallonii]CEG58713.1 protein of unknown function [Legionella fallonii LLAP-10]
MQSRFEFKHWLDKHKVSYIAHAIWGDNVEKVLRSGKILAAEEVLRKYQKVSYEQSSVYGGRALLNIDTITDFIRDNFSPEQLTHGIVKSDNITVEDAVKFNLISVDEGNRLRDKEMDYAKFSKKDFAVMSSKQKKISEIILKNGKNYSVIIDEGFSLYNGGRYVCKIQGIDSYKIANSLAGSSLINQLKKRFSTVPNFALQIAIDCARQESVNKILADAWDYYSSFNIGIIGKKSLDEYLFDLRSNIIQISKLNAEIRAGYNSIYWTYGDVVVLKGNPNNILSISSLTLNETWDIKKGEVYTLKPYENKGEYLSLELNQEDTIIIGPQNILSQYYDTAVEQGIRMISIESMTAEELNFFKVPPKLYPEKALGIEVPTTVIDKDLFTTNANHTDLIHSLESDLNAVDEIEAQLNRPIIQRPETLQTAASVSTVGMFKPKVIDIDLTDSAEKLASNTP